MPWQCIVGIIIMVISFIGVIAAAKTHREPVAMLCAVVMLIGLGMYAWFYFNPPPNTDYQVYGKAVAAKIGSAVKSSGASKAVWVTGDLGSEYAKMCFEAFKQAFGGTVESVTLSDGDMGGMMELNAKKLKEILKSAGAEDAVVFDVSMMMPPKQIEFLKPSYKGAKVFLTNNATLMGANPKTVFTALTKGGLKAIIIGLDKIEEDFTPDDDDLEEAFSKRYILVDANNFDSYKERFAMGM